MRISAAERRLRAEIGLPLNPVRLATFTTPQRGLIYEALDLDRLQIAVAEEATRLVLARKYQRRRSE